MSNFSSPFAYLKKVFKDLRLGRPGRRFRRFHQSRVEREESLRRSWKSLALIVAGVTMTVVGLLISLPPGPPGFLIWLPGLGLIVTQSKTAATLCDKIELLFHKFVRWLKKVIM